ncbi:MAG: hypothetical protein KAT09_03105 [Candidatus Aegiribacteria sp.]|nr:hypothetical protein [Candidatus Aegiribacteria sp.]
MKLVALLLLVSVTGICVADPSLVLVHYDEFSGYGTAVLTAISNVWPGSTVLSVLGNDWTTFNDALAADTYDVIILENWYWSSDGCNWPLLLNIYTTTDTRIFLADWRLSFGATGVQDLMIAMGVSGVTTNGSPLPHYAWEPAHEICVGISDWSQVDVGLSIYSNNLTHPSAVPVTGWAATATPGMAGICIASDGVSIISGYTPAYSTEGVAIWENILEFMGDGLALQQSTWGEIKSSF